MKRCGSDFSRRGEEQSHTALGELINKGWAVNRVAALCLFVICCSLKAQPASEAALPAASPSAMSMRIYQLPQGEDFFRTDVYQVVPDAADRIVNVVKFHRAVGITQRIASGACERLNDGWVSGLRVVEGDTPLAAEKTEKWSHPAKY